MAFAPPRPWTWEEHELSEGYSCIVYDADGRKVELDHIDRNTAATVAATFDLYDALARLERAYASALHVGYERILALGGDCDPPEMMERGDSALISARAALAKAEEGVRDVTPR